MTRLCIVAHGDLLLYGYLTVAFEHEVEGQRMEIIFDRRRPTAPHGDPYGVERRTHPAIDEILQAQGYVILDENGIVVGPAKPHRDVLPWKSAVGWAGARARWAWEARPTTRSVVRLVALFGALGVSAVFVVPRFSTHTDRPAGRLGAESRMAGAPTPTVMVESPPPVAAPPALMVDPPVPDAASLVASTPARVAVGSAPVDRPPAPAELMRRPPNPTPKRSTRSRAVASRPAAGSVTTPARESAPSARPTVVLETDPQGTGKHRSITYTASVVDASGKALTNADVSLLGWMPDGSDVNAPLRSTSIPGTYQGSVEVGLFMPGNLRVRIAHGANSFDIAPQRQQR